MPLRTIWLISLRDLQFRVRRFLIAVAVTALVFGIAVAIDGINQTLESEPSELVASFHADTWVVGHGTTGLFTSTAPLPESVVDSLRETPGVKSAHAVLAAFFTVTNDERRKIVNVIGFDGTAGGPTVVEGRAARVEGEAVIGDGFDLGVGDRLETTSGPFVIVGRVDGLRYNGGTPTVWLSLAGAQRAFVGGKEVVMGVAVRGDPSTLPEGTGLTTNQAAVNDLRLGLASATSTIDFVAFLTWLIAAGVIGAIVYLTAIERSRDFAVLRATGSPPRIVVGGLVIQSILLSLISSALAVPLALVLRVGIPTRVTLNSGSVTRILLVGILVGLVASAAAVRRALKTDPALAFRGL